MVQRQSPRLPITAPIGAPRAVAAVRISPHIVRHSTVSHLLQASFLAFCKACDAGVNSTRAYRSRCVLASLELIGCQGKICFTGSIRRRDMRAARNWYFCLLALLTLLPLDALATQPATQTPQTEVGKRAIASLPTLHESSADILERLDLTRPFETRTHWMFVVARVPGSRLDALSLQPVPSGTLAECFVNGLTPHCRYSMPSKPSSLSWYSTPVDFYSTTVVFAGAHHSEPLLLVKAGSAHGGDGSHAIFSQLFSYRRSTNRFEPVFSNTTGSNNSQETRFMDHGPLRGDVIVAVPTENAPYAYWVSVYVRHGDTRYSRVLRYRSATRYRDGNSLAVIDSEMPNILKRLGK